MKNRLQSWRLGSLLAAACAVATIHVGGSAVAQDSAESYIKDLHIRQKPMATTFKPDRKSELSVVATVDRSNRVYKSGDNVVLTVKATEDSYIWVFDTGTSGKVPSRFTPTNSTRRTSLRRAKSSAFLARTPNIALACRRQAGPKLITVVASKENKPLTADLLDGSSGGPFLALRGTAETVAKDLSITLRKQKRAWTSEQVVILIK